ncbi:hypothetical protein [uncultured Gilvimarinus sp.]|uniref:hypothetical protein n=1 Tax=uncultured Gilvimarinus sp. TaxID=1689143 RepID=UPI0030EE2CE1|tara:strand:- start:730 stop:1074 length:345 start_codon:yes stop_codon:yes gene_type:complete
MKIFSNGSSDICIDGRKFSGRNVTIKGNKVIVDGVEQGGELIGDVTVTVNGNVERVETEAGNVNVTGQAGSIKTMSGDVKSGPVSGSVSTMSGDVTCPSIGGSVKTMSGDIRQG